jgi:hypothetical protein
VDGNLVPEFWNALDGSIVALAKYEVTEGGIRVPLEFESLGSGFVVFRKSSSKAAVAQPTATATLAKGWKLQFDGKGEMSSHIDMEIEKLTDLAQSADDELKYFSGTINYNTTFNAEKAQRTVIDFDRVECMAKVYVNDQYAGGVWCEPYQVDISKYVREGENELRVEVVNKWVNRIVGDMQQPPHERKISLLANPYNADSPLPASGLIGEVKLLYY